MEAKQTWKWPNNIPLSPKAAGDTNHEKTLKTLKSVIPKHREESSTITQVKSNITKVKLLAVLFKKVNQTYIYDNHFISYHMNTPVFCFFRTCTNFDNILFVHTMTIIRSRL